MLAPLTKQFFATEKHCWNICLLGDTANPHKPASEIKHLLINKGHHVFCVTETYPKITDVPKEIDILIICMNPIKAYELIKQSNKTFAFVIFQPGTESIDVKNWLKTKNIPYEETCIIKFYQN